MKYVSEEDTDCWSLTSEEEMLLAVDGVRQKKIEAEIMIEGNKV